MTVASSPLQVRNLIDPGNTVEEYNDDGLADLTIRTSDGNIFMVHKWPLTHTSPIFRDMLTLPQGAAQDNPERDVVELAEDTKTIDLLLSVIYHREAIYVGNIDELCLFTGAAVKYMIVPAINRAKAVIREYLTRRQHILRLYALALKFDFTTLAERAFRLCLLIRLTNPYHYEDPALRDLPLEKYQQLLFSKTKRAEIACAIVTKHFRFTKFCHACQRHGCAWWNDYVLMLMIRLKDKPTSEVMYERHVIDTCCQNRCPEEVENLAQSEPYFLVIKAEIDSLPWTYQSAGKGFSLPTSLCLMNVS
jgi:hypothetical protein